MSPRGFQFGQLTKAEAKWLNDPDPEATLPGAKWVVIPERGGIAMRLKTEFFKSGDSMAIRTNARTEDDFIRSASEVLDEMIENERFAGDWEFQLFRWLPQIVDIACKLRGYKADVQEERVLIAGGLPLDERELVGATKESSPQFGTPVAGTPIAAAETEKVPF